MHNSVLKKNKVDCEQPLIFFKVAGEGRASREKRGRLFSSRPSPFLAKSVFSANALTPSTNSTELKRTGGLLAV